MACVKLVLALLGVTTVYAQEQCRTPHAHAGECILLERCELLKGLNDKRDKTADEVTFLRQSGCGLHLGLKPKICCPPKELWDDYRIARPIQFPDGSRPRPLVPTTSTTTTTTTTESVRVKPVTVPNYVGNSCPVTVKPPNPDSLCCGIESASSERIVGGKEAEVDQYPWLALLEYGDGKAHCAGSLISSRYVLTAAHCIGDTIHGFPRKVRLSEYNTSSFPIDEVEVNGGGVEYIEVLIIRIVDRIQHPQFDGGRYNDIGLVKLEYDAPYTDFIRPICLPFRPLKEYLLPEIRFISAGWGSTGYAPSEIKMHIKLPYVSREFCQRPYSTHVNNVTLKEQHICAGGEKDKDTCGGDSGGPLMYELGNTFVLTGIVSFGPNRCGTEGTPGVYTNVYEYHDWVVKKCV